MEGQILELLAERALATEQIGASLRAGENDVRRELEDLRGRGLVDLSAVTPYDAGVRAAAAYWRITDSGRAHLEQLRAEG